MSRLFGGPRRLFEPDKPVEPVVTAPVAAAPVGITADDLKNAIGAAVNGVSAQLAGVIGELKDVVTATANRPLNVMQAPAAAIGRQVTQEDIERAVAAGEGAGPLIREMVDSAVQRATAGIIKDHIDPLRTFGLTAIGDLSQRVVEKDLKFYPRFKKEIDAKLAGIPAEARANAQIIKMFHDAVVGEHAEELAREAAETAIRQVAEGGNKGDGGTVKQAVTRAASATPGGNGGGQGTVKPEVPTLQQIGGDDGLEALKHKDRGSGDSPDAFAQSLGYKDWNHYMSTYEQTQADAEKVLGMAVSR